MRPIRSLFFACLVLLSSPIFGQNTLLQSGPMVGYSEMMEAMLWVQTNASAEVYFAYWDLEAPQTRYVTSKKQTQAKDAFTAHLIADQIVPDKKYGYQLYINDQAVNLPYPTEFQSQELWDWRHDPPVIKMAVGSCAYVNEEVYDRPGNSYGGEYGIFESIHKMDPDLMLWLGDNTYLREVDYYSRTGILHRNTHTRSLPEMQALLASTHNYAIWDDHDFGPNDSDRSYIHKDLTLEAFKLFWGNPSYGVNGQAGVTSFFHWGDADFFLLDNRYFRAPNYRKSTKRTMLGEDQLEWVIDALVSSGATWKFVAVGCQVLSDAEVYENYARLYPEEREYLLQRIEEEGILNVVFLTGDRHHTELCRKEFANGNVIYDLTVSPLTSGYPRGSDEVNDNLVDGTAVFDRNFGILEITGARTSREMLITIYDTDGVELWNYRIEAQYRKK
ncbi:MAG: alkaline phosphatase family protein [Saprospiraceae bacterium]|nr:alkaline phosphatase family protein [Saprospiraceae bacterium]